MTLATIALNNLRRRKGRAVFLLIGLLLGVGTVVTLFSLTSALTAEAQHKMENFGANIIISPRIDKLSLSYGAINLGGITVDQEEIREADLSKLSTIPNSRNIALVAPKSLSAVQAKGERVLLMGIRPESEFKLKRWWSVAGRVLRSEDELVAGNAVAKRLGLRQGDGLDIGDRHFTVTGILNETGSQDDHLLLSTIGAAQSLSGKEGIVSLVEVAALCGDCPVEDMVKQISSVLPDAEVNAIQQVVKTRMHALQQFRLFSFAVGGVIVLTGGLVVFVTMMSSVNERTREIGIFRALGFRRSDVMRLILIESLSISFFSGVLGYLLGMTVTWLVLPFVGEGSHAWMWHPLLAVGAIVMAMGVGCLATIYPALHAGRMDPTEALRAL
ncbi:MAG: ABC transporter permease [Desulfuromonadaceae bacterium]|nr:ABC transporter permease [Desulfuromonadaceae bacterium]